MAPPPLEWPRMDVKSLFRRGLVFFSLSLSLNEYIIIILLRIKKWFVTAIILGIIRKRKGENMYDTVWGDDIVNKFLDTQDLAFLACCNM